MGPFPYIQMYMGQVWVTPCGSFLVYLGSSLCKRKSAHSFSGNFVFQFFPVNSLHPINVGPHGSIVQITEVIRPHGQILDASNISINKKILQRPSLNSWI